MITKILAIQNIGRFVSCKAAGDVAFRKLTLIFGENGRGKTTMGDILRSLSSGDPQYILGRATLGSVYKPSATIQLDGNNLVNFKDGRWDGTGPRIAIYDSAFVDENVHSGSNIDREQRKNLYGVIVGEEGVTLAKKVDDDDARIREINKNIKAKESVVNAYLPEGTSAKVFLGLSPISDVDRKIADKEAEVATLKLAGEIKAKAALATITLPQLPTNFEPLLATILEAISREAESRVKQHLATLAKPGGEQWIGQEILLSGGANCPYCGQSTQKLELVDAYQRYFSESYAEFKGELSKLYDSVAEEFGDSALLPVQRALDSNGNLAAFWDQFVPAGIPENPFDTFRTAISNLRTAALSRIKAKLAAPLEIVPTDSEFDRSIEQYAMAVILAGEYEKAIVSVNGLIATKKRELEANTLVKAKAELNSLLSVKKRFEVPADEACRRYSEAVASKTVVEEEKAAARKKLDLYCEKVFAQYEKRINELLDIFGAGFRIGETKTSLAGGTVSSSFQIIINKVAVDLGGPDTPKAKACFRNTLSSGDRSTLALAFFIAKLENDAKLTSTIVLFDDPFTSQDQSRRLRTQLQIRKLADGCRQVIVFSHDPLFLKQIVDRQPAGEIKVLQFFSTGEGHSKIDVFEIDDLTRPEYFKDYDSLHRFLHHSDGDARLVAPAIRRLLESYLRMKQPSAFKANEWLGDMIRKIRESGPGNPLHDAQSLLEDLSAINEYSQRFHHGQGEKAVPEIINPDELRTYIRLTLSFVGGF
jgi:wobble nucleotide-excising tRNase